MTKTEPPFPLNVKVTSIDASSEVAVVPAPAITHRLKIAGAASVAVEDEAIVSNTRTSTV